MRSAAAIRIGRDGAVRKLTAPIDPSSKLSDYFCLKAVDGNYRLSGRN
jgi:hypothetical protein